jgi:hypothetical protein
MTKFLRTRYDVRLWGHLVVGAVAGIILWLVWLLFSSAGVRLP